MMNSVTKTVALVLTGVLMLVLLVFGGKIIENVNADEIVVIQDPVDGELHWYTSPGIKFQGLGSVTTYLKRDIYHIEGNKVRFNDGGEAHITGSVQFDMPVDETNLTALHMRYGSRSAIKSQVIQTVVDKVLYMTGPLMSSRESYAEKRTDLIRYVQDQIDNGVYRNETRTQEVIDPLSGQRQTQQIAAIVTAADGTFARQESSVVAEFGIRAFNFSIQSIDYDDKVDDQITAQQEIIMNVQTAIAAARQAEQDRITTEQQGMARAAQAKWEQETLKAKAIVLAEQERDVARLKAEAAKEYEREQLLRANADATYKRQVMAADGALAQKLTAWLEGQKVWASAYAAYTGPMVPSIVMGGPGPNGSQTNSTSSAQSIMDMIGVKMAKDLQLDLRPSGAK